MLYNYILIAWRQLKNNRFYTLLNIGGLAVGVAACMLIMLFVRYECSYDRWNPLAERIVRPAYHIKINNFEEHHGTVDAVVGPEAAAALPEIENWCRLNPYGTWDTRRSGQGEKEAREERVMGVDSSFFHVFPFKILAGNPRQCLNRPNVVVISDSRARHYFGSAEKALGQVLLMGRKADPYEVSAVFADMPENAHFRTDMLFPFATSGELNEAPPYWGYTNNYFTYFLLKKGVDPDVFEQKFLALSREKLGRLTHDLFGTSLADFENKGQVARFEVQRLTDIHLHSAMQSELSANGNIRYVWIFSAIALFVLLLACINFMNLATARSAARAREVGVRKALGSSRPALAGQFLTESVVLATMAVMLATLLAAASMPAFRELCARPLEMPWRDTAFYLWLVGGALTVGLLAGSYPAFFLSAFQTTRVLKGAMLSATGSRGTATLRNTLVVFQFAVSTVLLLSTLMIYRQLRFIQQKNLGFDKEHVLLLENTRMLGDRAQAFKQILLQTAGVENATMTNYLPLPDRDRENCILSAGRATGVSDVVLQRWRVDAGYVGTLGLELLRGRNFEPGRSSDTTSIIINETAARQLGFSDPVGQKMYTSRTKAADSKPEDFQELTIIGVVRDFHFESLHHSIRGLFLQSDRQVGTLALRIQGASSAQVIAAAEQQWAAFVPGAPLQYHFMDETMQRMYASEQRVGVIALLFALLSALVSCLGLFGLAAYMTEQRTREIGIRKVLGASAASVTRLLAADFLRLVLVAFVLASPLAWYFMQRWLQDFAYNAGISWWMFTGAAMLALVVAALTVGFQSIRAALANPVKALRQ